MIHIYPDFYKDFHCLAGACPDTCCKGWDIVIDPDTARRYETIPGALGNALRQAMTTDEDGDLIIRMGEDGYCPLLTEDKLCRVQIELGDNGPCGTCQKFPRLTQDYGKFIEYGLTIACPEAARLILTHKGAWKMETVIDAVPEEKTYLDWDFMEILEKERNVLLSHLEKDEENEDNILIRCLKETELFQKQIDGRKDKSAQAPEASQREYLKKLLMLHRELEILTPQWSSLLDEGIQLDLELPRLPHTGMVANLAADYLYRYWFQAVNDGDCLTRMGLLCINWIVVKALARIHLAKTGSISQERLLELFSLYAKEVEHDDDNREQLEEVLLTEDDFTTDVLIMLLK